MTRETPSTQENSMETETLTIILTGSGGELDRKTITVEDDNNDMDEARNLAIHEAIEDWRLSPGDSITIETVSA